MSIICIICARSGSKGLKNKTLKKINNKPLIAYTISLARRSKIFNHIVVSTDSKKIQTVSKKYGATSWFLRPKSLSNDNSPKIPAIRHAFLESEKFFNQKFNICVDLDITSPLRNIKDIKNSISKFLSKKSDILFSINESKKNPYFNMIEINKNNIVTLVKKIKKNKIIRRQDAPKVYEMNASIYIYKRKFLLSNNDLFTKKTSTYLMPRERSIDIDDKLDFNLVKHIIQNEKKFSREI